MSEDLVHLRNKLQGIKVGLQNITYRQETGQSAVRESEQRADQRQGFIEALQLVQDTIDDWLE